MEIAANSLSVEATYKLLVGSVVPRPIAWVTTVSKSGLINAAPFSAFTFVSSKPPMLGVSIGRKLGVLKDTARNIIDQQEFVVNIGDLDQIDQLHLSAEEFPEEVSEVEELSIETAPSRSIATPRIAKAPISMECKLHRIVDFGERTSFYVGEVIVFNIRDDLLHDGKIETKDLRPICRLGGPNYSTLGEILTKKTLFVSSKDH